MNKLFVSFLIMVSGIANAEVVEKTAAIVNNELVLESDLRDLNKRLGNETLIDDTLLFGKPVSTLKNNRKAQLEYLINEKIIQSEVKRLNLTVTPDRVESEIREMAKRYGVSNAELANIVKKQGLSISEYKVFLKDNLEKKSLFDVEIISKLRISDEDALNEYLKKNPNNTPSIDEFSVAHIFFSPKKGGSEGAIQRGETVLAKLRSGENFEKLAQQFSEDTNFSAGGSLGTFKSGDFLPEIESAISALQVNETTNLVRSRIGYHIVKLTGKKLTPDPRFERVKEGIKGQLLEESFKRQLKNWISLKKDESFVRINE